MGDTVATRTTRSRWAAIGAAVAVSLGAGGLLVADAADPPTASSNYVGITPCRVIDTRAGTDNVGPRSTPIGPDETFTTPFVGTVGRCDIPAAAVAVVLNVAAVNPTTGSFVTVFPAGGEVPLAANLNVVGGQPPVSNAATVRIGAGGSLSFYNLAGTVDVTADVSGYYLPAPAPSAPAAPGAAKRQVVTIAGPGIRFNGEVTANTVSGCATQPPATSGRATIPLQLPVGATINSWSVTMADTTSTGGYSVDLVRWTPGPSVQTSTTVMPVIIGGGQSAANLIITSVRNGPHVVDASSSYTIEVNLGATASANGVCRIQFDLTLP